MTGKPASLDATRFGPWALITGASSGLGAGIAEQIAASEINVLLAARRLSAALHHELLPQGVNVTVVLPGAPRRRCSAGSAPMRPR